MISAMEDAMKSCIPYFKPIIGSYINDEMSVYAAQASFFMILAVCLIAAGVVFGLRIITRMEQMVCAEI